MRLNSSPIDRIAAIIENFHELELYCTQLEETLAKENPALFVSLPPRPIAEAMIEEKYRSKIYGPRARANRDYMRRLRARMSTPEAKARIRADEVPIEQVKEELDKHQISEERKNEIRRQAGVSVLTPEDLTPGKLKL
jgi:hypothetical protein